jgi:hypothetical protein
MRTKEKENYRCGNYKDYEKERSAIHAVVYEQSHRKGPVKKLLHSFEAQNAM